MRKKRIIAAIISMAVFLCIISFSISAFPTVEKEITGTLNEKTRIEVQYFYMSPCESCRDGEKFLAFFEEALSGLENDLKRFDFRVPVINTFKSETSFIEKCDELGIPNNERFLPMLVIGDQYIQGQQVIEEELGSFIKNAAADDEQKESSGSICETKSTEISQQIQDESNKPLFASVYDPEDARFVYFYTDSCKDCAKTLDFFEILALEYSAEKVSIDYKYILDPQIMEEWKTYVEIYDLPEEHESTPIIFYNGGYLHGYQAIQTEMQSLIEEEKATQFVPPDFTKSSQPEEINPQPQTEFGFQNILNPYFISVILVVFVIFLLLKKMRGI